MPSQLRQGATKLVIRREAERAALRALRDARPAAAFSVSREDLEKARSLDDCLLAFGWRVVRGVDGAVRSMAYVATDYTADEKALFDALSPYVEPASIVDLWLDGDAPKRFKFTGRSVVEKRLPPELFAAYVEESDDEPPPSRLPSFSEALATAPSARRKYTPTEKFEPGEWIEHVKFGAGLVQAGADPGKARVLFADGERVLVQAR
ncbi:MAG: hypothetical protein IPG50_34615 [Myxococcales bacterium]|nr:hypothetical protein [Myxococcales bacterium]